ncbi:type II secretion system secretin GspD [Pseudomonas mediterranea]|uniref:General secretion pathway protein D n=1 Tax=Pseudomonas mediterranea TaxID=183795 RepID=A0AAX2D4X5_9PSED|nr:type II secretion system secretin GspD [Pseudomonas mediterranea]KGU86333.1 general secretion pathway protein GspD [Pseudomonas mediterranea CFBP 5447]MBL0842124.1 type II secretion system secretin GspD [Pseudomonas mediterranea]MDU9026542.1 type II secretion system secretin GspD [Pseudomonas mediterranea]UZE01443.1 type II secretion system secretin GspD [Pseudomonas mediterranea]SDU02889.1 general secretion pathway protein D [Pseudomonas mediterranea]
MNSVIRSRVSHVLLCLAVSCPLMFATVARAEEARWQLAMNNAELRDVVEEISAILGKTVVLDPRVSGRISVMSREALDREGVRRLFYSVLDAHNFTVIDEGERILITPVADGRTRAGSGDTKDPAPSQFVTRVIDLQSSIAADVAGLIRPLVSGAGYIGPSVSANALVVTDTAANVQRITRVAQQLDSGHNRNHEVVQLRHARAGDIASILEASGNKREGDTAGSVIADARGNRLVIIGAPRVRQRLAELARTLDVPASAAEDTARVIRLRHSDAKQLAEVLEGVGQDKKAAPAQAGLRESAAANPFMIKADESQNALVLIAEPAQVRTIENIVRELDQPRAQVLIHAAIVEISGDIAEALGVQWGIKSGGAEGVISFSGTNTPIIGELNPKDVDGVLLRLGGDRFSALISALASNTRSNLLSTPSLLTLDNQEAEIIVGKNVPFKTGSYATNGSGADNPFTTVERKDVGISLKIKPYINQGSSLRLEVQQEVSDIAPSVAGVDSSDLITNKRALKSTILADDGEIIVIGGLIRDDVRSQESGVPLLRSIPYLGALFRWTRDTQTKSNLMVFLRPTIVRGKEDLAEVSRQRYDALRELSKPGSRQNNSLLLPRDARQLFESSMEPSSTDPLLQKRGDL